MKPQIRIGLFAAVLCLVMPFLSRIPRGGEWVIQYLPDQGHLIGGVVFFGAFAMVPAVAVFGAAILSKPPFYFPLVFSTLVAIVMLGYWHHDNDLAADAQAAISLIFIPIYTSGLSLVGGLIGIGFQLAAQRLQIRAESGRSGD